MERTIITNADTIASELAIALSEVLMSLWIIVSKNRAFYDAEDDSSVENINQELYSKLKAEKIHTFGMIPKLDNCFRFIHRVQKNKKLVITACCKTKTALYTTITLWRV
jgi:acetylglutamate kinase